MLVNKGGQKVGKGTYWNPSDGHRIDIIGQGVLPGSSGTTYLKMPAGGMLVVAPVVGLAYVIFLPVFGLMAVVGMWLVPVFGVIAGTALAGIKLCSGMFSTAGRNASFGWTPSTAYLAGKKASKKKDEPDEPDEKDEKK